MEEQIVGTKAWAFWLRNRNKISVPFPISSLEWKKQFPNEEDCPICKGKNGRCVRTSDGSIYQCVCLMPTWRDEQIRLRDQYQSRYEKAWLHDLVLRDGEKNSRDLRDAIVAAGEFTRSLDKWLVLSGVSGTGKSHILRAIATEIYPIGLFITATDFERKVFESIKNSTLDTFILNVSQSAVLLFDDFGAEYGSDIVKSKIAAVFIARDHQAKDLPVAVTTNLTRTQVEQVPRVGSRLLNQDNGRFLSINMADYRTRDYRVLHPERLEKKW